MRLRLALLSLPLLLSQCPLPAYAASCPLTGGTRGSCAATIGTGAVTVANASTTKPYKAITIDNESTSATIACTDDGTTPAINTAGSWTIAPGLTRQWPTGPEVSYGSAIQCIASASSTPVTVKAQ